MNSKEGVGGQGILERERERENQTLYQRERLSGHRYFVILFGYLRI